MAKSSQFVESAHYEHAPILEAVIDIHAVPSVSPLEALGRADWAPQGYERLDQVFAFGATIVFGESGGIMESSAPRQLIGYRYLSGDKERILQVRESSFTFSKLPPYDRWEPFAEEAHVLWDKYVAVAKPERVTRIGVRYINRIEIPLPIQDLADYLRVGPQVSPDLPQALSSFVLHLEIPQEGIQDCKLVLNEGIVESAKRDRLAVLLDIDVFKSGSLDARSPEVWEIAEKLRDCKNQTFEACITEKTRGLIR